MLPIMPPALKAEAKAGPVQADTCLSCGYDLAGLTDGSCPECGKSFCRTVRLGVAERPVLRWRSIAAWCVAGPAIVGVSSTIGVILVYLGAWSALVLVLLAAGAGIAVAVVAIIVCTRPIAARLWRRPEAAEDSRRLGAHAYIVVALLLMTTEYFLVLGAWMAGTSLPLQASGGP